MSTPTLERYAYELRAQGYSERTIESKVGAPRRAGEWAGVEPHELTREDVLAWLGATRRADNTRIKYVEWISQWCAWAGLDDVTAGIRKPSKPLGIPKPVSELDLRALIAAARTPRERCWVLLGAFCGLRSHESARVAVEDLEVAGDGEEHLLRVLGKGGQIGVVPCPPVVVAALLAAAVETETLTGRLWPTATSAAVQGVIRMLADRAGVSCSSHQLRHRYGTAVYSASSDLLLTQQALRHKSPTTTAGYAQVAAHRAHAVVLSLPGAAELVSSGRPHLRIVR